eukprot:COSAG05_NODE_190_length_14625_cov_2729.566020_1_plen_255_part_10
METLLSAKKRKTPPPLDIDSGISPPPPPRGMSLPPASARFKEGVGKVIEQRTRTRELLQGTPGAVGAGLTGDAASYTFDGCTLWAGCIPKADANEAAVVQIFGRFGRVKSVVVRTKDDTAAVDGRINGRSWALVTFCAQVGFGAALRTRNKIYSLSNRDAEIKVQRLQLDAAFESTGGLPEIWREAKRKAGAVTPYDATHARASGGGGGGSAKEAKRRRLSAEQDIDADSVAGRRASAVGARQVADATADAAAAA